MTITLSEQVKVLMLLASLLLGTSLLNYRFMEQTGIRFMVKGNDLTDSYILFLTRLMVVSLTMLTISFVSIFVEGKIMKVVIIVFGLLAFLLMLNIERLPIWSKEE